MIGEIIAIGDELTSGRILNTTSVFAASQLYAAGHDIVAMATVGDSPALIEEALKKAISRADFIVVTGGLGPTSDDLTNETVAQALDRPPTLYPEILELIEAQRGQTTGAAGPSLEKLAWLPKGAEVLNPSSRMAGYMLVHARKPIFFLPGVPYEMKQLLRDKVLPRLASWTGKAQLVEQRLFKIFGLSETEINRRLLHLEGKDRRIRLGYYPVFPEVHLNLTVIADQRAQVDALMTENGREIEKILGNYIFALNEETFEGALGQLMRDRGKTLAVAESCSGGLISHKLTRIPGSSDYFIGGVVAYSNSLKESLLGVPPETIGAHGAVSAETARAMAEGVRRLAMADFGVSVTGIAGPSGGSVDKPVGLVFIGMSQSGQTTDHRFLFSGDRWQIQELSCQTALELVRRTLLGQ